MPEAWLVTSTTRRALDVLRSARLQREPYPGVWLPEPIATDEDPGDRGRAGRDADDGLPAAARAVDTDRAGRVRAPRRARPSRYDDVAEAVGRSEPACRQALHRARQHVSMPTRRTPADRAPRRASGERLPGGRSERRLRRADGHAGARRRRHQRRGRRRARGDAPGRRGGTRSLASSGTWPVASDDSRRRAVRLNDSPAVVLHAPAAGWPCRRGDR